MNLLFLSLAFSLGIYLLFILFFLTGLKRIPSVFSSENITWPKVSVIIAARNEENNIPLLIQDLHQLDYPSDRLEIVIADDRSNDNTWSLIKQAEENNECIKGIKIEHLEDMTPKKHALTKGIEASSGEFILSTDADCRLPSGWVKSMVSALDEHNGIVIGASSVDASNSFGHYQLVDFLALVSANAGANGWGYSWTGTGQNIAYKRSCFNDIGGFNPVKDRVSGDDVYLVQSIGKRFGSRVNADPHSFVKTQPAHNINQFINQRIRWSSNSRFAAKVDLFFLFFLVNAFVLNTSFLLSIFQPLMHEILPMIFAVKFLGDALVIYAGASKFKTSFPSIMFILWSIIQPIYIPVIGLGGLIGRYSWKP